MVSNTTLVKYYEQHKADFPVVFSIAGDSIIMAEAEGEDTIAALNGHGYEVYPSNMCPYVFIESLPEDASRYHLEYSDDDAYAVLSCFVDCVYLKLNQIRREIEHNMAVIEGRKMT